MCFNSQVHVSFTTYKLPVSTRWCKTINEQRDESTGLLALMWRRGVAIIVMASRRSSGEGFWVRSVAFPLAFHHRCVAVWGNLANQWSSAWTKSVISEIALWKSVEIIVDGVGGDHDGRVDLWPNGRWALSLTPWRNGWSIASTLTWDRGFEKFF